ncbi:hypothetical protein N431DRAFT_531872 [Stipitochalara longipes BDJ]|nr:hypothetical protein N431DRAFT_531872 [Stipitochalara longipes BDJ]
MENLNSRRECIAISSLSESFQDAVLITRTLGYRFLWIDCLCIIQDSIEDWQAESVKMAEIYSNTTFMISADAAADSHKGIFNSANNIFDDCCVRGLEVTHKSVMLPVHSPSHGLNSLMFAYIWDGHCPPDNSSFLQTRAWAFQEAALSRRRLRYTQHGIHWNCGTTGDIGHWCNEVEPDKIHDLDSNKPYTFSIYHIPHNAIWWYRQVDSYTSRWLTFPGDRFPSMSGLAKAFAGRTGWHYKAGIWLEDLYRGLLWTNYGVAIDLNHSPSWSWGVLLGSPSSAGIYDRSCGTWQPVEALQAKLIDVDIRNANDNHFGQVLSASLHLKGLHHSLKRLWPKHDFCFGRGHRRRDKNFDALRTPVDHSAIRLFMDVMDTSLELFWKRRDVILLQ